VSCEVCGSASIFVVPVSNRSTGVFGKCKECLLFQNLGTKEPLIIDGIDFCNYSLAQDLNFEKNRRGEVLSKLKNHLNSEGLELNVFDIGTGTGSFLSDALEEGFTVSANELSQAAAALVVKNYGIDVPVKNFEDFEFFNCQNAVTMFCVLAHSFNPELLLRSIYKSLRNGGILYFHTPRFCLIDWVAIGLCRVSFGSLDHILLRRISGSHRRIYSQRSMLMLLTNSGFTKVHISKDIGYGLRLEYYFIEMGLPRILCILLSRVLNQLSKVNLLPRNVFTVYAVKTNS